MWIMTRCGALTAALLMAVLLLTGCEEATSTPKDKSDPTPAPEDTPRPPMGKPTDPKPAHEAIGVTLDTVLKWSAAEDTTGYVVYFGTDPTPDGDELIGEQANTSFEPEGLEHDTIYYWRVDSKNESGGSEPRPSRLPSQRKPLTPSLPAKPPA